MITTALLLLSLFIFISIDLCGQSYCNTIPDKYMKCQTAITQYNIPLYMCKTFVGCDCALSSDCPTGCKCASPYCYSDCHESEKIVNVQKSYNIFYGITIIIISILSSIVVYLYIKKWWIPLIVFIILNLIQFIAIVKWKKISYKTDCNKCEIKVYPVTYPISYEPTISPTTSPTFFNTANIILISNFGDRNIILNSKNFNTYWNPNTLLNEDILVDQFQFILTFVQKDIVHYFEKYVDDKEHKYSSTVYLQDLKTKQYLATKDGWKIQPGWQDEPYEWTLFNYNYKTSEFIKEEVISLENMDEIHIVNLDPKSSFYGLALNVGNDFDWNPHLTNLDNNEYHSWQILMDYKISDLVEIMPASNENLRLVTNNLKFKLAPVGSKENFNIFYIVTFKKNGKSYLWILAIILYQPQPPNWKYSLFAVGTNEDKSLQDKTYNWEFNGLNIENGTYLKASEGNYNGMYLINDNDQLNYSDSSFTVWKFKNI